MLLCRVSVITDVQQQVEDRVRLETRDLTRVEIEKKMEGVEVMKDDSLGEEIEWPQLCERNATLQIPSFKKKEPSVGHGGSTFQKKRLSKELVREKMDPAKHAEKSGKIDFPMGEKAHLPQDVLDAIQFITENEPDDIKAYWKGKIEQLQKKAFRCRKATEEWKDSLSEEQKKSAGEIKPATAGTYAR